MTDFLLRAARTDDAPSLLRLAGLLDSVNLPNDPDRLRRLLDRATRSIDDHADPSPVFLFVLEARPAGDVIGCSMIVARHGTPDDPHNFLRLDVDERFSPVVGRSFRHASLNYRQSFTPHTELGALVLDPSWRGHPGRPGKLLSWARLLFIAAHRHRFCDTIQAELLPPLEPDGTSLLWEWLGRPFTGLDYRTADRLSVDHREFIPNLFPRIPFYLSLMPPSVRDVVGKVGDNARPVAAMLEAIGFRPNGCLDPFDGGPHFEARTDEVTLIRDARAGLARPLEDPPYLPGIAARIVGPASAFAATFTRYQTAGEHLAIAPWALDLLGARDGDQLIAAPLPSPGSTVGRSSS